MRTVEMNNQGQVCDQPLNKSRMLVETEADGAYPEHFFKLTISLVPQFTKGRLV